MALKTCPRCKASKPLDQFEKDKRKPFGRGSRCYDCTRARYNPGWQQSYRQRNAGTEAARRRRNRHMNYAQEYARDSAYYGSPEERARHAVRNAVKAGTLRKPMRCERCGLPKVPAALQAHHEDYEKPLDVQWYCSPCHGWIHRKHKDGDPTEIERLREDNARLRAALEDLVQIGPSSTMGDFNRAQARAREVLSAVAAPAPQQA